MAQPQAQGAVGRTRRIRRNLPVIFAEEGWEKAPELYRCKVPHRPSAFDIEDAVPGGGGDACLSQRNSPVFQDHSVGVIAATKSA